MRRIKDPATGKMKNFYSRKDIGLPRSKPGRAMSKSPKERWFTHHGVGRGAGLSLSSVMSIWRGYDRYHRSKGWGGVGYSAAFVDAPDVGGAVFEGRGFGRTQVATQNNNSTAHSCCFIGDGRYTEGSAGAWEAHRALVAEGQRQGWVADEPQYLGHDDVWQKECPGGQIKRVMRTQLTKEGASPPEGDPDDMVIYKVGDKLFKVAGHEAVYESSLSTVGALIKSGVEEREWKGTAAEFKSAFDLRPEDTDSGIQP